LKAKGQWLLELPNTKVCMSQGSSVLMLLAVVVFEGGDLQLAVTWERTHTYPVHNAASMLFASL
jgi:hypothetical protein